MRVAARLRHISPAAARASSRSHSAARPATGYFVYYKFNNKRWPPRTSLATQQIVREFGWEVLMHPHYSSDLTPSDFHLFQCLQNSLGKVRLTSREDC
ncbi:Histone-lysine N-methyltransferase SETMAR [Eumeta japonica]|uniref:Histone-lysine N-methyltransferase SETMAR n=1 Tax=Eumeta variegata TaxID=151549 RepID=A0A4C1WP59_EUMVA|nr:Histone-lysine N-methyltransferase SETMAR [Eumeta japonica]